MDQDQYLSSDGYPVAHHDGQRWHGLRPIEDALVDLNEALIGKLGYTTLIVADAEQGIASVPLPGPRREVLRQLRAIRLYRRGALRGHLVPRCAAPRSSLRGGRPSVRGASRRSSARSGDSGDDGSGEPESPGGARVERLCLCGCGRDLSHKRTDARTFDSACRKRVERAERKAEGLIAEQRDAEARVLALPARLVPLDPLEGVDPDVLWCLYHNEGLAVAA